MKKSTLALLVAAQFSLLACSSNPVANLDVNAQRVAVSSFDRDGIRLTYTLDGKLTSVESIVYTPIFGADSFATESAQKRSEKISKAQLKKFIDKKTLSSQISASIISINLEHASWQQKHAISDSQNLVASDREVFLDASGKDMNASSESSKVLDDATKLTQLLDKNTDWREIDADMTLSSARPINHSQTLEVIYRWTAKPKN